MASITPGQIFNLKEAEGTERVKHETTAAAAQAEAKTSEIAREVEKAADSVQEAAENAAQTAWQKGPSLTGEKSALDDLQRGLKSTTDAAAEEGKHDVQAAAGQGTTYMEQAKAMASGAAATVQSYLPSTGDNNASTTASNIAGQVQTGAAAALETASGYLSAANQVAQPHIDKAKELASTYIGQGSGSTTDPEKQ